MRARRLHFSSACAPRSSRSSCRGSAAVAAELPTPDGATLRGTVQTDAIRELPDLKGARQNPMRDESVTGVRVLDQTWDTDVAYHDAVRFYDRQLGSALTLEHDRADTATGWLVKLDDGTIASVTVRNTRPTTIEIQKTIR